MHLHLGGRDAETFVEGIHPLHIKGMGRAVRLEGS